MNKILGIGNALVDIMTQLPSDAPLHELGLPRGSMQLVDAAMMERAMAHTSNMPRTMAAGGSAANTVNGLANLGLPTAFIGKIGADEVGQTFRSDMQSNGIEPMLLQGQAASGRALVLVSPDSERTFATYLGAAVELSPSDLRPEMFAGARYFHIEGYLVQNHDLVRRALELAHEAGLKVSLDLASYNVVEEHRDFLRAMLEQHVSVVFANEEEARAFGGGSPEATLAELAELAELAVVKLGKAGSLVRRADEQVRIGVSAVDAVIDSTGAGDLYSAGFIYGLSQGMPLDQCGRLGAIVSGAVIGVLGPKMDALRWQQVRQQVAQVV